jgi:hypothetical protein
MAMIVHELIPMCQRLGLGTSSHGIGTIGISMGGYGRCCSLRRTRNCSARSPR